MRAKGNIVDHEYEIDRDGRTVATVSKRWFRVRDTYGVEMAPGEDDALVLAIAVCVDAVLERLHAAVQDDVRVTFAPGEDDALVLAIAVCVDAMSHRGN